MSDPIDSPAAVDRTPPLFWLLGAILVAYVAACVGGRGNLWGADAWEHHRAFKALTDNLWHPGNPTFEIDTPSARYTPYSVFWATACRVTGLDPYHALSLAATVNTAVLVLGVWLLLSRFGEAKASAAALVVMVSLYGGNPDTTNTYAFADLPVHQVNFSAASFGWALVLLGVFQGYARGDWGKGSIPVMIALSTMTMLDHGITGSWGQFSLWLLAITAPADRRLRLMATVLAIQICVLPLCLLWPWYHFLAALGGKTPARIVPYGIQYGMSAFWCVPGVVLAVLAMTLRDRRAVRVFLIGGYLFYLAGLLVWVVPINLPGVSSISRYPMPGLIFAHLALAIYAQDVGLFRPGTWPGRFRLLFRGDRGGVSQAAGEIILATAIAYFLVPQVAIALKSPHLVRPYIAKMMHKVNKQLDLRALFRELLAGVATHDVILSDIDSMWIAPSINGRIVQALHAELFVTEADDLRRETDSIGFFLPGTGEAERVEILRRYNVRWIILNRRKMDPAVVSSLLRPSAVTREVDFLILMDAAKWIEAGPAK